MPPTPIPVYTHSHDPSAPIRTFLHSHLPNSLSLLRRLQHGQTPPTALLCATFPPSSSPTPSAPFAICFFAAATPPSADAWLFSSLEVNHPPNAYATAEAPESTERSDSTPALQHLLAVLQHVRSNWTQALNATDPPSPRSMIKLGTVHNATARALRSHGSGLVRDDVRGPGGPYRKYIFRPSDVSLPVAAPALPEDLRLDVVREEDYDAVIANNKFVGGKWFLRELRSVGVRDLEGRLVSWAFVGPDGSVRTVHVEEGWRRRGLGRAVVRELVKVEGGNGDGDGKEERWCHTEIAGDNKASVALFEGFGARWAWDDYWILLDLDALPEGRGSDM